jgi:hypothetical protein
LSAAALEAFLARIYVDADALARFRANPRAEAANAGLSAEECAALDQMDWPGLELAARSFARKRARKQAHGLRGLFRRLFKTSSVKSV